MSGGGLGTIRGLQRFGCGGGGERIKNGMEESSDELCYGFDCSWVHDCKLDSLALKSHITSVARSLQP